MGTLYNTIVIVAKYLSFAEFIEAYKIAFSNVTGNFLFKIQFELPVLLSCNNNSNTTNELTICNIVVRILILQKCIPCVLHFIAFLSVYLTIFFRIYLQLILLDKY